MTLQTLVSDPEAGSWPASLKKVHNVIPSSTTFAMGFRQTKGPAFSIAARHIAEMFLAIGIIVGNVGTNASLACIVATGLASILLSMPTIVASAVKSVSMGLNASMDIVGMLRLIHC